MDGGASTVSPSLTVKLRLLNYQTSVECQTQFIRPLYTILFRCSTGDPGLPGVLLLECLLLGYREVYSQTVHDDQHVSYCARQKLKDIGIRYFVGRTVRQFLMGTMAAPVCYSFLWITIFGGAGDWSTT